MAAQYRSFREHVEKGHYLRVGKEPPRLWLIPLTLRTRPQYYEEAARVIRLQVERLWEDMRDRMSREDFDRMAVIEDIWNRSAPPWWELNDLIGFVDIRVYPAGRRIDTILFLPRQRISRSLARKTYGAVTSEAVRYRLSPDNRSLREEVIRSVRAVLTNPRARKLHVNMAEWERVVAHTDIAGIIRSLYPK